MKRIIFILSFILVCLQVYNQTDTIFWFAAPEITNGHGDSPIYLHLAANERNSWVTISQPANPSYVTKKYYIPKNSSIIVTLNKFLLENNKYMEVDNKGLLVQSSEPITCYYELAYDWNTEIFSLKGNNGLGTEFRVPGQYTWGYNPSGYNPLPLRTANIVATEDNTSITIIAPINLSPYASFEEIDIVLNRGETYSVQTQSELSGTLISSDKPIAVTYCNDSQHLKIGSDEGWDALGDQLVPIKNLGLEYIALRGHLNLGMDLINITATEMLTEVYVNGTYETTLHEYETYDVQFNKEIMHVRTTKPCYAMHLTGYIDEVCGALLPPTDKCTGSSIVSFKRASVPENRQPQFYINLMIRTDYNGKDFFQLYVEGEEKPNAIPGSAFDPVDGTNWLAAQVDLTTIIPIGKQCKIINSADFFHCGMLYGSNGAFRYGYFSDFNEAQIDAYVVSETDTALTCTNAPTELTARGGFEYTWSPPTYLSNPDIPNPIVTIPEATSITYSIFIEGRCDLTENYIYTFEAIDPVTDSLVEFDKCLENPDKQILLSGYPYEEAYTWYSDEILASEIKSKGFPEFNPSIVQKGNYNYYVAREDTTDVCGVIKIPVILSVHQPEPPTYLNRRVSLCDGESPGDISAFSSDTVKWYEDAATANFIKEGIVYSPPVSTIGNYDYYTTGTDKYGCVSEPSELEINIYEIPPMPLADDDYSFCYLEDTFISVQIEDDTEITWYSNPALTDTFYSKAVYQTRFNTAGTYTFYVTQSKECASPVKNISLEIRPLPSVFVNEPTEMIDCWIDTIQISGGGTGTYLWTTSNGKISSAPDQSTINISSKGTYYLEVTGSNGCTKQDSMYVGEDRPFAGYGKDTMVCNNRSTVLLDHLLYGNSPGGTWYNMPENSARPGNVFSINGINAGTYKFKYQIDKIGTYCDSSSADATVQVFRFYDAGTAMDAEICNTGPLNLFDFISGYDTAGYWLDITTPATGALDGNVFRPEMVEGAEYQFSYNFDSNVVCPPSSTLLTLSGDLAAPLIHCSSDEFTRTAKMGHDYYVVKGTEFDPTDTSDNCLKIKSFYNNFNDSTTLNGEHITDGTEISWYATDYAENTGSSKILINVQPFEIYNIITPNGDGINDTWDFEIDNLYPGGIIYVYNRWGELVFVSDKGYHAKWDGKAHGKPLPTGTYHYIIEENGKAKRQGFITILSKK